MHCKLYKNYMIEVLFNKFECFYIMNLDIALTKRNVDHNGFRFLFIFFGFKFEISIINNTE